MMDRVMNEAHVIYTRQQCRTKDLAIARDAAHTHAAKTDAVVAPLAANENGAVAFATGAVVSQRNFH